jgi:putative transposase
MEKLNTESQDPSRITWDHLEEWVRRKVQELIQALLEEEVTELLGRAKSERRQVMEALPGYRNGYGEERNLTLSCGTIKVHRPRVRGLEERFESRLLPLFARRSQEVDQLIPELYLHGLAQGDFDLALRGLLGEEAPISASTVARLKEQWQGELKEWKEQSLAELEVVYLWVDGVYVKAGLEKEKAALLVVLGGLSDGRKVVQALEPGYRESIESWLGLLRDLKGRGMNNPKLVVGDGNLGLWGALGQVFPEAGEQRCWNHKLVNVLDKLPKKVQWEAKGQLQKIAYAPTLAQAEKGRQQPWSGTGSGWSAFTSSPRSTGSTCGRLTQWSLPLLP